MIDTPMLMTETIISLSEAARRLPASRGRGRACPSTIWRWITAGVRMPNDQRLRLEGIRMGGRWLTTVEALIRFAERQTAIRQPDPDGSQMPFFRTPTQRRRANEAAARQLEKMGL